MTEIALGSLVIVVLVIGLATGLLVLRQRLIPAEALTIDVNGARHVLAQRGETLLDALHNADIPVPAACGGKGTCGLCRVTVTGAGAGQAQATERGVLSPKERRDHLRLACQTNLRGDCTVQVPDGILSAGAGFPCAVASTRMLAPLIREIVLERPKDGPAAFHAGDFMQITAPPYSLDFATLDLPEAFRDAWQIAGWRDMRVSSDTAVTRAYSLANRPQDAGSFVFNIRLAVPPAGREGDVPPGLVSSWLFTVQPGDRVMVSGPFGEFHVQPSDREMVYVGGGVGMAPLRAMIHRELGRGMPRRTRYFYGARTAADLFYDEEFEALARDNAHFSWTPVLSDPAPGDRWTGAMGFIHEILSAEMADHPAPENCEYYLCGPPLMISAVLATLERLGVAPDSIFYDDFGA